MKQSTTHLIQLEEERRKMEQKIQQLDEQWREADVESQESQHLLQQHIEQIGKIGSQLDAIKGDAEKSGRILSRCKGITAGERSRETLNCRAFMVRLRN